MFGLEWFWTSKYLSLDGKYFIDSYLMKSIEIAGCLCFCEIWTDRFFSNFRGDNLEFLGSYKAKDENLSSCNYLLNLISGSGFTGFDSSFWKFVGVRILLWDWGSWLESDLKCVKYGLGSGSMYESLILTGLEWCLSEWTHGPKLSLFSLRCY